MQIETKLLSGALGAEIKGIDLTDISDENFQKINDLLLEHKVIFFRNQNISSEDQINLAKKFGPLEKHVYVKGLKGHPEIIRIIKGADEKHQWGETWHTDVSYNIKPTKVIILRSVKIPPVGGDTMFSNMEVAYETLDKKIKEKIKNKKAIHSSLGAAAFVEKYEEMEGNGNLDEYSNEHPIVRTHPETNKKILYWAADPKPFNNIITKDAKHAYNNFKNFGIAKCDSNGKVTVHFKFPQIYSTVQKGFKKPQTYHPHLHFVITNHNETGWLSQIYTKILIKKLNYNEVTTRINNKNYLLLNTLPCEYYAQDHIPNSFNLFHKQIKKMSTNELHTWFLNVIKRHYNDLYKLVKSGKMHIYEIPIICYCAHKDCNASELALEELAKKGFVNCSLYEGGMKEYNQKHKI